MAASAHRVALLILLHWSDCLKFIVTVEGIFPWPFFKSFPQKTLFIVLCNKPSGGSEELKSQSWPSALVSRGFGKLKPGMCTQTRFVSCTLDLKYNKRYFTCTVSYYTVLMGAFGCWFSFLGDEEVFQITNHNFYFFFFNRKNISYIQSIVFLLFYTEKVAILLF